MNRSFLLKKAHDMYTVPYGILFYNYQFELNTIFINGKVTPACTASTMITVSKTDAAPGDDDPDPDIELMY